MSMVHKFLIVFKRSLTAIIFNRRNNFSELGLTLPGIPGVGRLLRSIYDTNIDIDIIIYVYFSMDIFNNIVI